MAKKCKQRLYCPQCGRRIRFSHLGRCPVHNARGVTRARFRGIAAGRTRARRKAKANRTLTPSYLGYLNSPEWQTRRRIIIARDRVCRLCYGPANHVHHIHYRTLFRETGDELVLLCEACHRREHKLFNLRDREPFWSKKNATRKKVGTAHVDGETAKFDENRRTAANGEDHQPPSAA